LCARSAQHENKEAMFGPINNEAAPLLKAPSYIKRKVLFCK